MKILVCIDDTDNLESRGTGELASILAEQIETRGWGISSFVTRHQLLVHPDIPYTSHNSAMCFEATLREDCPSQRIIEHAGTFLTRESAPESDPGLCVVMPDLLSDPGPLLAFGQAAKERVLTKQDAYDLAARLGLHLSEHGGSGQGVVGALAGAGLRLGGNDGRLKGQLRIGLPGEVRSVASLQAESLVEEVRTLAGAAPRPDDRVELGEKIKTVLIEGRSVLLLEESGRADVLWKTCSRQRLKNY